MAALRRFVFFWYDFIVGDDPFVAIGVVLALAATALLVHGNVAAWWLLPVAVVALLLTSLWRATKSDRAARRGSSG